MTTPIERPYWRRFLIGFFASSVLVFACSLSLQLHTLKDPEWLLLVILGVTIASIPGAGVAALLARRNELLLILGSQALTVSGLVAWFAIRA